MDRAETLLQESRALVHHVEEPHRLALAYEQLGVIACRRGDYERASELLQFSLQVALDGGCESLVAHLHLALGALARERGSPQRAHEHFRQGLDRYRALAYPWGIAHASRLLADAAYAKGDRTHVQSCHEESLRIYRALDDQIGEALVWNGMGQVAQGEQRYDEAEKLYRRAAEALQEAGDPKGSALAFNNLGCLMVEVGRFPEAKAYFRAGFEWATRTQDAPLILRILVGVAGMLARSTTDEAGRAHIAELLTIVSKHRAATAPIEAEAAALIDRLPPRPSPLSSAYDGSFRALEQVVADALAR
jgi:tetratricopeptide (TPR) repeat protein